MNGVERMLEINQFFRPWRNNVSFWSLSTSSIKWTNRWKEEKQFCQVSIFFDTNSRVNRGNLVESGCFHHAEFLFFHLDYPSNSGIIKIVHYNLPSQSSRFIPSHFIQLCLDDFFIISSLSYCEHNTRKLGNMYLQIFESVLILKKFLETFLFWQVLL